MFLEENFTGIVDDYEILETIDLGGMGAVFKARHIHLNRVVALKVNALQNNNEQNYDARFRREMSILMKLDHPGFVKIFDAGNHNGFDYFVMEYIDGLSLDYIVKNKGMSYDQIMYYFVKILESFSYAHDHGIVHRDIKPKNILINKNGQIKILDLGIAKDFVNDEGLTRHGDVYGTAEYMPPEQACDSKTADQRADIYSLGCVLYFMMTGEPPFIRENSIGLMYAHVSEEPPNLPSVPNRTINKIYKKMLAKDPNNRYQNIKEILLDITNKPKIITRKMLISSILGIIMFITCVFLVLKKKEEEFVNQKIDNIEKNIDKIHGKRIIEESTKIEGPEISFELRGKEYKRQKDDQYVEFNPNSREQRIKDMYQYNAEMYRQGRRHVPDTTPPESKNPDVLRDDRGWIIRDYRTDGYIRDDRGYIIGRSK